MDRTKDVAPHAPHGAPHRTSADGLAGPGWLRRRGLRRAGSSGSRRPAESDYLAELQKLSELKAAGVINDEEFEAKKKQLLGI